MHHTIVVLEALHIAVPTFNIEPPDTASIIVHQTTTQEQGPERIKDATIVVCTRFLLTSALLDVAVSPKLQFIAQVGTGYDNLDLEACRKRGIVVANTPGGNTDTVAEHALSLFFGVRRNIVQMHERTMAGEWKQTKSLTKHLRDHRQAPPIALSQELVGIVGYGRIGRKLSSLMQGLGAKVVVACRKRVDHSMVDDTYRILDAAHATTPVRTSLQSVLRNCSTVFLACPLTDETVNLISTKELALMRHDAVVVNVGRGGVVDEAAMVQALNAGKLWGFATDVFETEPTGVEDSDLLSKLEAGTRFIASPHVAWYSEMTVANLSRMLAENVHAWIAGNPQNVIS